MLAALAREFRRGKEFVLSEFATTCCISAHRVASWLTRFKLQPEQLEKMEVETILHSSTGLLARDDVTKVGDGEDVFLNVSGLGFGKTFDPIWRKDQIEVERAVFELNKIFASDDFSPGVVVEHEAKLKQGFDHAFAIFGRLRGEYIDILSGARIAEQNGAAFADEEILNACVIERPGDFLCLKRVEWQAVVHSAGAGWNPR
jgi:hypothetical protein